jgi:hypothetical protein
MRSASHQLADSLEITLAEPERATPPDPRVAVARRAADFALLDAERQRWRDDTYETRLEPLRLVKTAPECDPGALAPRIYGGPGHGRPSRSTTP